MAKKKDEEEREEKTLDPKTAARLLRNSLNKDGQVCWDLSQPGSPTHVKNWIPSGSTLLDYIISNRRGGGIAGGKVTEIAGEEASGKSLLCAHIIAETQRRGGIAVYIDSENASNPDFMIRIGVDITRLIYIQPGTIENAFEHIESVIKTLRAKSSTIPVTIIWDSVGNTPPKAEVEGTYDPNSQMGIGAKAMARGMRKLTDLIGKEEITLVFTNPLKFKIGASQYEDPFITPYGKAVPYACSTRVRLTSSTKLKDESGTIYGVMTNARVIKSRLGPAHRSVKFEIHFDHGIDDEKSWFMILHEAGMIEKAEGWCYISELPSGKIQEKGVHTGKDRGLQFREKEWAKIARSDKRVRDWALNTLEKLMVVKYDAQRPEDRTGTEIPNEEAGFGDEIETDDGTGEAA